jgi:ABC-type branched-subunit amino acid transport system ATPase component
VSYRYGDHLALEDVALELERGEIFGLLGPNGGVRKLLGAYSASRRPDASPRQTARTRRG